MKKIINHLIDKNITLILGFMFIINLFFVKTLELSIISMIITLVLVLLSNLLINIFIHKLSTKYLYISLVIFVSILGSISSYLLDCLSIYNVDSTMYLVIINSILLVSTKLKDSKEKYSKRILHTSLYTLLFIIKMLIITTIFEILTTNSITIIDKLSNIVNMKIKLVNILGIDLSNNFFTSLGGILIIIGLSLGITNSMKGNKDNDDVYNNNN